MPQSDKGYVYECRICLGDGKDYWEACSKCHNIFHPDCFNEMMDHLELSYVEYEVSDCPTCAGDNESCSGVNHFTVNNCPICS